MHMVRRVYFRPSARFQLTMAKSQLELTEASKRRDSSLSASKSSGVDSTIVFWLSIYRLVPELFDATHFCCITTDGNKLQVLHHPVSGATRLLQYGWSCAIKVFAGPWLPWCQKGDVLTANAMLERSTTNSAWLNDWIGCVNTYTVLLVSLNWNVFNVNPA